MNDFSDYRFEMLKRVVLYADGSGIIQEIGKEPTPEQAGRALYELAHVHECLPEPTTPYDAGPIRTNLEKYLKSCASLIMKHYSVDLLEGFAREAWTVCASNPSFLSEPSGQGWYLKAAENRTNSYKVEPEKDLGE